MAGNTTFKKRQKEAQRAARHQQKLERREQRRKESKDTAVPVAPGEDPDLAGIVPGPQPVVEEY
jgi:hypothetical protein